MLATYATIFAFFSNVNFLAGDFRKCTILIFLKDIIQIVYQVIDKPVIILCCML